MMKLSKTSQYRAIPALALSAWLALAGAATAQVALTPVGADPDATLVEELVVTAREAGPALWRVEDADTVVYVLGVPSLAPKRMQWDQTGFLRRLKGANVVILPPGTEVKFKGALGAGIAYLRLKTGKPFEETVSDPTRGRFAAARAGLGQPADHYKTRNPLAAALVLLTDYREKWSLTTSDPMKLIRLLAQQNGVRTTMKTYDLGPLLASLVKVPSGPAMTCLNDALAQVEAGPQATLAATRAWAAGDVRTALSEERIYERCFANAPGAAAFDARVKADQAAQIVEALKTPGHAIALVQLRPLLAQGGVLDRLRAQGFKVHTPGEEEETP